MKRWLAAIAVIGLLGSAPPVEAQQAPRRFDAAMVQDTDRVQAIEYSDAYAARLTIHRIGSYAILPLFASEYLLGRRLIDGGDVPDWVKPSHVAVASAVGVLFASNTVTGVWNLWESRRDPAGRTRRYVHAALMLAADAGFAYTGLITSGDAAQLGDKARQHRDAALVSMSLSTAGTLLMWLWQD